MYQDMIFPVKCKHPEIDSVPSRQEVTTSSLNVMDLERMPGPQKRELSLLRPPEVSVRSKLHSSQAMKVLHKIIVNTQVCDSCVHPFLPLEIGMPSDSEACPSFTKTWIL